MGESHCVVIEITFNDFKEVFGEDEPSECSFPSATVLSVEEVAAGGFPNHLHQGLFPVFPTPCIDVVAAYFADGFYPRDYCSLGVHLCVEEFAEGCFVE